MDLGSLLHVAQKNAQKPKNEVKYYSTKFEPPKKEERSKQLSSNIKKFLARKEAEEKQKNLEALVKRDELLALRSQDRKATRRVAVMLKRTKSANKSVIEDAVDNDNTAVTLAGPSQPDEDDYGYVSQEASAFYNKMMAKYSTLPEEDKKFAKPKKNVNTNLKEIKERVRAAIQKEHDDALLPHRRKRKPKEHQDDEDGSKDNSKDNYKEEERQEEKPRPKPRPPAPPPMNFNDLLKIAEKKQFEPIKLETKVRSEEDERLMTKRQKREYEKEKAWKEKREERLAALNREPTDSEKMAPPPNKIPKLNSSLNNGRIPKISSADDRKPQNSLSKPIPKKSEERPNIPRRPDERLPKKSDDRDRNSLPKRSDDGVNIPKKSEIKSNSSNNSVQNSSASLDRRPTESKLRAELEKSRSSNKPPSKLNGSGPSKPQLSQKPLNTLDKNKSLVRRDVKDGKDIKPKSSSSDKPKQHPPTNSKPKQIPPSEVRSKQYLPGDIRSKQLPTSDKSKQVSPADRPKQFPPADVRSKQFSPADRPKQFPPANVRSKQFSPADRPKQFPPADVRPKQFPPADVRPKQFPPADLRPKQFPPNDVRRRPKDAKRKPPMGHKRRILDDDDSEYDSEMDDFIDDGTEGQEDYSKYISEIFGYDKSRYRNLDDADDNMESSFSQMMREEFISSKIGLMEDLEDMKLEAEEKKKKERMKKNMSRK